jgi:hypothetical protein
VLLVNSESSAAAGGAHIFAGGRIRMLISDRAADRVGCGATPPAAPGDGRGRALAGEGSCSTTSGGGSIERWRGGGHGGRGGRR